MSQPPQSNNTFVSNRNITKIFRRIKLNDGDVLLVKKSYWGDDTDGIRRLADTVARAGHKGVILIGVDQLDDIRHLNESEMNRLGWFRVPALKRIVHVPNDGESPEESHKDE